MAGNAADRAQRRLTTTLQLRAAAIEIADRAERSLALFSHGLEPALYDQIDFVDTVTRLVLAHRYARVRVLVVDAGPLVQESHRLVAAGRRLVSFVEFRRVQREHRRREDGFLIADDHSVLYLAQATHSQGEVAFDDRHLARRLLREFDEMWTHGGPEREAQRLGM
jgi:hypothetical protein